MSNIYQAFKDDPAYLKSIIPLDFDTLKSVPESHEWPRESFNQSLDSMEKSKMLPVIDLMHPEAQQLIAHATKTWGMFQTVNHGVSMDLLQSVEDEARRLFNLPTHDKLKVLRTPDSSDGYGVARIAPFSDKCMWHEGFTILGQSCAHHAKMLWPNDHERFCNVMSEYRTKMKPLAVQVLQLLLKSLDISEEAIETWAASTYSKVEGAIQLNSYPCCPDPSRVIGLAPHTDTLLLTILNQCQISGLQIFKDDIGWISVPPISGALVINVGDILHILSNGEYPSVRHRVTISENKHRISYAYFQGLNVESEIEPLHKVEKRVYKTMLAKEFIGIKAKHNDDALSMVKL